mmetsp:Transcript_64635/g.166840  ORF Transcript_64635/g.166840 Transcript_64635/m.166840 type:complete len:201 (-) Transcript_64635:2-604(-)
MAEGELTLDDLIVDPARSLLLVAALIKTEVLLRTRITVGQAPQPGQQRCVDALAEGRLKVACELAVPMQELDGDHGVRDGIRCLLSLRHALLARRPRDGGTLLLDQGLHRALVEAARGLLQLAARHREHRPRRTPRCRDGQSARSYTAAEGHEREDASEAGEAQAKGSHAGPLLAALHRGRRHCHRGAGGRTGKLGAKKA